MNKEIPIPKLTPHLSEANDFNRQVTENEYDLSSLKRTSKTISNTSNTSQVKGMKKEKSSAVHRTVKELKNKGK